MSKVVQLIPREAEPVTTVDLEIRIQELKGRLEILPDSDEHAEILREILRLRGEIRQILGVRTSLVVRE